MSLANQKRLLLLMVLLSCLSASFAAAERPTELVLEPVVPIDKALQAYEQGYQSYKRGQFRASENRLIEAIKLEPNLVKAHYWLGKLYREQGRLEDAIFHWEEVERLNALIKQRRAALMIKDNEYPAHPQTLRATRLTKEARDAYEKGVYLLDKGHWNGAEVELRQAVILYPANHKYLITLARVLWDKNEKQASIKFYRDLMSLKDVSLEHFLEGIDRIFQLDMKYVAIPLILLQQDRFASSEAFQQVKNEYEIEADSQIAAIGKVIKRNSGQVIINLGSVHGLNLNDEFRLNLRAFKPGRSIFDPDTGKQIGFDMEQRSADLLVTKVNQKSSWALIRREFGSGVKEGDLIEIQKIKN